MLSKELAGSRSKLEKQSEQYHSLEQTKKLAFQQHALYEQEIQSLEKQLLTLKKVSLLTLKRVSFPAICLISPYEISVFLLNFCCTFSVNGTAKKRPS